MKLLPSIPNFKIAFKSREENDDEFVKYEGGGDTEVGHGHSHGPSDKDLILYKKSMFKLKLVSSVSIFFIIC